MADIAERAWKLKEESMLWPDLASIGTSHEKELMHKRQEFFGDVVDDLEVLDV